VEGLDQLGRDQVQLHLISQVDYGEVEVRNYCPVELEAVVGFLFVFFDFKHLGRQHGSQRILIDSKLWGELFPIEGHQSPRFDDKYVDPQGDKQNQRNRNDIEPHNFICEVANNRNDK
jgi:hypothetical protein